MLVTVQKKHAFEKLRHFIRLFLILDGTLRSLELAESKQRLQFVNNSKGVCN